MTQFLDSFAFGNIRTTRFGLCSASTSMIRADTQSCLAQRQSRRAIARRAAGVIDHTSSSNSGSNRTRILTSPCFMLHGLQVLAGAAPRGQVLSLDAPIFSSGVGHPQSNRLTTYSQLFHRSTRRHNGTECYSQRNTLDCNDRFHHGIVGVRSSNLLGSTISKSKEILGNLCNKAAYSLPPSNRSAFRVRQETAASGNMRHFWAAPKRHRIRA